MQERTPVQVELPGFELTVPLSLEKHSQSHLSVRAQSEQLRRQRKEVERDSVEILVEVKVHSILLLSELQG